MISSDLFGDLFDDLMLEVNTMEAMMAIFSPIYAQLTLIYLYEVAIPF